VNRRVRLALLLAALAVAGPSVSAQPTLDAARSGVSIAWFRVTPARRPQLEMKQAGPKTRRDPVQVETCASPDAVLPDTLRVHSLFQRPPPLHS
jgi:hypothetical protein